MSDLPHDAKSSYEHTRTTEPEGRMLPPWEKLGIEMRIALINAFRDGGRHSLDMISHQLVDRSPKAIDRPAPITTEGGGENG